MKTKKLVAALALSVVVLGAGSSIVLFGNPPVGGYITLFGNPPVGGGKI